MTKLNSFNCFRPHSPDPDVPYMLLIALILLKPAQSTTKQCCLCRLWTTSIARFKSVSLLAINGINVSGGDKWTFNPRSKNQVRINTNKESHFRQRNSRFRGPNFRLASRGGKKMRGTFKSRLNSLRTEDTFPLVGSSEVGSRN